MNRESTLYSPIPKQSFSRIGWAIFAFFSVSLILQFLLSRLLLTFAPSVLEGVWGPWLLSSVPMYLFAFPLFSLILRPVPKGAPKHVPFKLRSLFLYFFVAYFLMYVGNTIGTLLNTFTGFFGISSSSDALEMIASSSLLPTLLIGVVIGPFVEEVMFRKLILERLYPFGEKFAILASALLFALFHANLTQFVYAFLLGAVFGYLYCRTGKLRYPVLLHMAINLMNGLLPTVVLRLVSPLLSLQEEAGSLTAEALLSVLPALLILVAYLFMVFLFCLVGLILLCCAYKRVFLLPPKAPLPSDTFPHALLSKGVILGSLTFLLLFILSYL